MRRIFVVSDPWYRWVAPIWRAHDNGLVIRRHCGSNDSAGTAALAMRRLANAGPFGVQEFLLSFVHCLLCAVIVLPAMPQKNSGIHHL